ncbi:hypothetical protein E4Z66_12030 [Aliishimia ponticola]|uniref:Uncharacterized protein n=1 Tax=Aliishimia ponticola TaxID=2499833 RepID=A0A4S4NAV3_9RHOB|nr:hypothetical protein [Aliishimia ponticola]THH35805.1 hypothetical protein E4Z66_12030 [Aliishimia ponticola]
MGQPRWHILRDGEAVILCRHLPPRFDMTARTVLPGGSAVRLAHQIRQDMWRALQRVRGFSPVVRLTPISAGWQVEAGGRVPAANEDLVAQVQAVLDDKQRRTRWVQFAQRGEGA